jgi:hypothetical protein
MWMQKQYKMQNNVLDTEFFTATVVDGILEVQYKDNVYITIEEAKNIVRGRLKFFGDAQYPCLLKSSKLKGVDREARKYLFTEGVTNLLAIALVPKNKVGQMLTTILVNFEKPDIACRVFKSHEAARQWLRQYIGKGHE